MRKGKAILRSGGLEGRKEDLVHSIMHYVPVVVPYAAPYEELYVQNCGLSIKVRYTTTLGVL